MADWLRVAAAILDILLTIYNIMMHWSNGVLSGPRVVVHPCEPLPANLTQR